MSVFKRCRFPADIMIDFMLSDRRNTKAARRFLAKALKVMRNWPPVSITTDKLASYPKAHLGLRQQVQHLCPDREGLLRWEDDTGT
jgi:transposase-like protein